MALNRKTFKKAAAGAAADTNLPSGYFNTVTYTGNGGTQKIGGYINRGAVFNGSSSNITLPTGSPFNDSNTIKSVSAWVKLNSTSDRVYPFSVSSTTVANDFFNFGYLGDSNNILLAIRDGSSSNQVLHSVSVTIDTNWHHIVAQTTGNSVEIYLDGVSQTITSTYSGTGSSSSWISYPSYGGSVVGNIGISRKLSSVFSNGSIDQVRIFNKALNSNEVTTLSNETHASTTKSTTDIFSDNSGVALYQLDGNANDTGGVSGYIGEGAIFNGSSSKIETGITNSLIPVNYDFTISAWVKIQSTGGFVFAEGNWNAWSTAGFGIQVVSSNRLELSLANNGSSGGTQVVSSSLNADTWVHMVATINIGNSLKLYINGAEAASTPLSANSRNNASGGFYIGSSISGIYYNGSIDQVRIYSKALSSSEVTTLYTETASSNITISDLVAYYPMDGNSLDQEGSYHGTDSNVEYNYSGTATNVTYQDATNFIPDLVWIKGRVQNQHSGVFDSVRGADLWLRSGTTDAENDFGGGYGVTSFDSNGFTIGSGSAINANGDGNVAWCFNAGTDAAVSNTDGSITSTVKANTDAGFSIVKYTGNGTAGATIGHGLSSAPELIFYKRTDSTANWIVKSTLLSTNNYLLLNGTAASAAGGDFWNGTDPTSTVFTTGNSLSVNGSGADYIAYNFHSVDGIQKVGSYTGTGVAGNSVVTGFEPAFVMVKRTDSTSGWLIVDNDRGSGHELYPHSSSAELSSAEGGTYDRLHLEANGFTFTGSAFNESGSTWIYLAIAADPDTTTPTVEDSFEVVTYTGSGGTQSIDTGFKPDLVWVKNRDVAVNHYLYDSIRGTGAAKALHSNTTSSESSASTYSVNGGVQSIDTNGFTVFEGTDGTYQGTNKSGNDYVAWCWKAGDHDDNLPQINTEGTIDSTVSVNDAAGFSIVKYSGTNTVSDTVGHGLSSPPEMVIIKNISDTKSWAVRHADLDSTKNLYLNATNQATTITTTSSGGVGVINSTTVGFASGGTNASNVNISGNDFIAYCFTSITGYQKIGSYTASSGDDVVTTGFKPRFVMLKRTDSAGHWEMHDAVRFPSLYDENGASKRLRANDSGAEALFNNSPIFFTDTGFTLDSSVSGDSYGDYDANGGTYIYLAIK